MINEPLSSSRGDEPKNFPSVYARFTLCRGDRRNEPVKAIASSGFIAAGKQHPCRAQLRGQHYSIFLLALGGDL